MLVLVLQVLIEVPMSREKKLQFTDLLFFLICLAILLVVLVPKRAAEIKGLKHFSIKKVEEAATFAHEWCAVWKNVC